MLCVETVNAAANAVTLAPGEAHTMQAMISVEQTAS
jgi:glucose-6-phosphate 1-epimerase